MIYEGIFLELDKITVSKWYIPYHVGKAAIDFLKNRIERGDVILGEVNSYTCGRISLQKATHQLIGLEIYNGNVIGTIKILESEDGLKLLDALKHGMKFRTSCTGVGHYKHDKKKDCYMFNKFMITTFDLITSPGNDTEYLSIRKKLSPLEKLAKRMNNG